MTDMFKFYQSGIYDGKDCDPQKPINHSALAIGYNLSHELPYLVLRNSWGKEWGEKGFYRMAIGEVSG